MGFEVTHSWKKSRSEQAVDILSATADWVVPDSATEHIPEQARKPIMLGLSVTLHSGLLYLLITNGLVSIESLRNTADKAQHNALAMLDLKKPEPEPQRDQARASGREGGGKEIVQARPVEIDMSKSAPLPIEWSVSQIAIEQNPADNSAGGQGLSGSGGYGDGAGRQGVYDPYAGASPQRREDQLSNDSASFDYALADPDLDKLAYEAWLQKLKTRLPRATGTVELSVTVSNNGQIKAAKVTGGDATLQLKLFVRSFAVNERMFSTGGNVKLLRVTL